MSSEATCSGGLSSLDDWCILRNLSLDADIAPAPPTRAEEDYYACPFFFFENCPRCNWGAFWDKLVTFLVPNWHRMAKVPSMMIRT